MLECDSNKLLTAEALHELLADNWQIYKIRIFQNLCLGADLPGERQQTVSGKLVQRCSDRSLNDQEKQLVL